MIRRIGSEMVFCFGDSITAGYPGVSFLHFLKPRNGYVNHGLGGDTVSGCYTRVRKILPDERCASAVLEIGANDVLLPHLERTSPAWKPVLAWYSKRGSVPCRTPGIFSAMYGELIDFILKYAEKLTVISIPMLGERPGSELNDRVDTYNNEIQDIALRKNLRFVDFNLLQRTELRKNDSVSDYFIDSFHPAHVMIDAVFSSLLPFSTYLGVKRGLLTTVDGVHLNDAFARKLASAVMNAAG